MGPRGRPRGGPRAGRGRAAGRRPRSAVSHGVTPFQMTACDFQCTSYTVPCMTYTVTVDRPHARPTATTSSSTGSTSPSRRDRVLAARAQRRRQDDAGPHPRHAAGARRRHRDGRRPRPAHRPDGVRRSISLTGQYAAVDEVLTGDGEPEMMARLRQLLRARPRGSAYGELLASSTSSTPADRRVGTYSGGMMRRLDLAISMIERPALLFLDEPTTGLDPRSREQVWGTRAPARGRRRHDPADDAVPRGGRPARRPHRGARRRPIVADGTAAELKSTIGAELVRLELADPASYARAVAQSRAEPPRTQRCSRIEVATDGSADRDRSRCWHGSSAQRSTSAGSRRCARASTTSSSPSPTAAASPPDTGERMSLTMQHLSAPPSTPA